ncbi:hypothetical protein ACFST9_25545 [Hymenobacter monticola]|uniref:Uncharacterized protein n=1 Tax=Hymenobacter monticola TaxID=1705399 RepID=A0ABY4BA70_9BACT|nr:hypothetical protein [Hymenobacter monticola]UOE34663.1 hypothetical protein MTP16_03190 [Hymenobacter monticola]
MMQFSTFSRTAAAACGAKRWLKASIYGCQLVVDGAVQATQRVVIQ